MRAGLDAVIEGCLFAGPTEIVVADGHPFFAELTKAAEQEAKESGYLVVICNAEDRPEEIRRYVDTLLRQGLDGVIRACVGDDETETLSLLTDPRRIVFANRHPAGVASSDVGSDNQGGSMEPTRCLLSRGYRRIGFIGGRDTRATRTSAWLATRRP